MRHKVLVRAAASAALCMAVGLIPLAAIANAAPSPSPGLPSISKVSLRASYTRLLAKERSEPRTITYARGHHGPRVSGRVAASCTEPQCPLVYGGGAVQHTSKIYLLFWGPKWSNIGSDTEYLTSFMSGLGVEPQDTWSTTTGQYGDNTGHPTFSGSVLQGVFQDTSTPPYGATQTQLAAEADAFYSSHGLTDDVNTQIVVATQSGTCPSGFYAPSCAGGSGNYCAWHSYSSVSQVPYTNLPYLLDAGGGCGENSVNSNGTYDGFSIVEGHEYAETVTDPFPASGWYDYNGGGEIGDKCEWQSLADVTLSTGSFAMQPLWSNSASACVQSTPVATTYSLALSKSGTGSGKVTSAPAGINCGTSCSANFSSGTSVTLTESPARGTTFTGWSGACIGMSSPTCKVTMNTNTSVGASFTGSSKLYQETSATYRGTWSTAKCKCFSGGTDKYATAANASATFKFTGNLIQFVSEQSPIRGSCKIYIDGTPLSVRLT